MRASRGFTLIELLVVLVIIGIATSMAVISIRGDSLDQVAEEELRRIAALLELASDQAVLEGKEYGVEFDREGYRFVRYDEEQWSAVDDDKLLRQRRIAEGLLILLYVEQMPVSLTDEAGEKAMPQLLLYSSGERTPFELTISEQQKRPTLRLHAGLFDALQIETITPL